MKHFAAPSFWDTYQRLPVNVRKLADQCYEILKSNPRHPSLHFKRTGKYSSVRVGLHYRALALQVSEGLLWFWIGRHDDYRRMIKEQG